jgi:hypothetical protein
MQGDVASLNKIETGKSGMKEVEGPNDNDDHKEKDHHLVESQLSWLADILCPRRAAGKLQ